MKAFIVVIIAVLLVLLGLGLYIAVSGDNGLIPPYDGPEDGDPDSGDDTPSDQVSVAISITAPNNPYTIPSSGDYYGGYYSIRVFGRIYGLNASSVTSVYAKWKDTNYGPWIDNSLSKVDDYNYDFEIPVLIQRLGTGKHLLTVKAKDTSNNWVRLNQVLVEATLEVNIPSSWIYHWDSRNPVKTDCAYDYSSSYGFCFPYQIESDDSNWYYLEGKISRVTGQVQVDMGLNNRIYLHIWDGYDGQWIPRIERFDVPDTGWSQDFDISFDPIWGNEIAFSNAECDDVDGFVGDVYIKPGTLDKNINPLSFLLNLFNTDSQDKVPLMEE